MKLIRRGCRILLWWRRRIGMVMWRFWRNQYLYWWDAWGGNDCSRHVWLSNAYQLSLQYVEGLWISIILAVFHCQHVVWGCGSGRIHTIDVCLKSRFYQQGKCGESKNGRGLLNPWRNTMLHGFFHRLFLKNTEWHPTRQSLIGICVLIREMSQGKKWDSYNSLDKCDCC